MQIYVHVCVYTYIYIYMYVYLMAFSRAPKEDINRKDPNMVYSVWNTTYGIQYIVHRDEDPTRHDF